MLKMGQIVAYTNRSGTWKITGKIPASWLGGCIRYNVKNVKTGEILNGCRDKDIIPRAHELFEAFSSEDWDTKSK